MSAVQTPPHHDTLFSAAEFARRFGDCRPDPCWAAVTLVVTGRRP